MGFQKRYKAIINPEEVKMLHILTSIFKVMAFVILLDIPYTVPSKEVYQKRCKHRIMLLSLFAVYSIVFGVLAILAKTEFLTNCLILYFSVLVVYIIITLPKYFNTDYYNKDYKFLLKKIYDKKFSGVISLNEMEENHYEIKNGNKSCQFIDEQLPKTYLYKVIRNMLSDMIYQSKKHFKFFYYEVEAENISIMIDGKEYVLVKNHKFNAFKFFLTHYQKTK